MQDDVKQGRVKVKTWQALKQRIFLRKWWRRVKLIPHVTPFTSVQLHEGWIWYLMPLGSGKDFCDLNQQYKIIILKKQNCKLSLIELPLLFLVY